MSIAEQLVTIADKVAAIENDVNYAITTAYTKGYDILPNGGLIEIKKLVDGLPALQKTAEFKMYHLDGSEADIWNAPTTGCIEVVFSTEVVGNPHTENLYDGNGYVPALNWTTEDNKTFKTKYTDLAAFVFHMLEKNPAVTDRRGNSLADLVSGLADYFMTGARTPQEPSEPEPSENENDTQVVTVSGAIAVLTRTKTELRFELSMEGDVTAIYIELDQNAGTTDCPTNATPLTPANNNSVTMPWNALGTQGTWTHTAGLSKYDVVITGLARNTGYYLHAWLRSADGATTVVHSNLVRTTLL